MYSYVMFGERDADIVLVSSFWRYHGAGGRAGEEGRKNDSE